MRSVRPITQFDIKNFCGTSEALREAISDVEVEVGGHSYYKTHELAIKFRIPEYQFKRAVISGAMAGKSLGKITIVDGESFRKFILSKKFNYKGKRTDDQIEADAEYSSKVLDENERTFLKSVRDGTV